MLNRLPIVLAIVLFATAATGQDQKQPLEISGVKTLLNDTRLLAMKHPAARYLGEATIMLAEIDVAKLNVDKTIRWAAQFSPSFDEQSATQASVVATGFVESLKSAGAHHIYVVADASSVLEGGPVVIVPCDKPRDAAVLANMLMNSMPETTKYTRYVGENVVIFGPKAGVARAIKESDVDRSDLTKPLQRDDRLHHSMVFSLPNGARTELEAFWPDQAPEESPIQFSPKKLVQDLDRIFVTWFLPPDAAVRVIAHGNDKAAAESIHKLLQKTLGLVPELEKNATLTLKGTQVTTAVRSDKIDAAIKALLEGPQLKASRMEVMNDVKQILLGFHNYLSVMNHWPPRAFVDKASKPIHSWRTAILPYVEQNALYDQLDLKTAWDSKANEPLSKIAIPIFGRLTKDTKTPWKTCVRAPVFPGGLWFGEGKPRRLADVTDGTSNTIAVIIAPMDSATPWASTEQWIIDPKDPMRDIFGDRDEIIAGFLDGSVHTLTKEKMTNKHLAALLTIAGGEVIE